MMKETTPIAMSTTSLSASPRGTRALKTLRRCVGITFVVALAIIATILLIWPSFWTLPLPPLSERLTLRLLPAFQHGGVYVLGADEMGRAMLLEVARGLVTSIQIAALSVFVSVLIGLPYGSLAAWRGGWFERIFLMIADGFQAFPGMLLAIGLAAFLPPTRFNLIGILGIMGWVSFGRVARAQVMSLREREFIVATQALGLPLFRVMARHLLPNMIRPLVVQASFALAGVILAEATLSFLGLGLPPTTPSLGKMMDSGVYYLLVAPHLAIIPGLAIFSLVLTFNVLGDRLADHLDPKGRRR